MTIDVATFDTNKLNEDPELMVIMDIVSLVSIVQVLTAPATKHDPDPEKVAD